MRESANMARAYDVRLHTHLAETVEEEAFCLETFGQRPRLTPEPLGGRVTMSGTPTASI